MCEVINVLYSFRTMSLLPGCDIILLDRYGCVLAVVSDSLKHAKHCVQVIFHFQGRDPAHTHFPGRVAPSHRVLTVMTTV